MNTELMLETYLKTHPDYNLVRWDYKITYTIGVKHEQMRLFYVVNKAWPKGMWRVSSDLGLCQYFGASFQEAKNIFERGQDV